MARVTLVTKFREARRMKNVMALFVRPGTTRRSPLCIARYAWRATGRAGMARMSKAASGIDATEANSVAVRPGESVVSVTGVPRISSDKASDHERTYASVA